MRMCVCAYVYVYNVMIFVDLYKFLDRVEGATQRNKRGGETYIYVGCEAKPGTVHRIRHFGPVRRTRTRTLLCYSLVCVTRVR